MAFDLIRPDSVSRPKLYSLLMIGVLLGVLVASLAVWVAPTEYAYIGLGVALLGFVPTMLIIWLLRLWLVGRVGSNIDGRISPAISQFGLVLVLGGLGLILTLVLLLALLFLGIFLEWDLSRWGHAMVAVVAVHMMLRAVLGIALNASLITHRRSHEAVATNI